MKKWSAIATMVFALGVLTIAWSLPQSATADEQARLTGNENHNIELLDAQQMIHHFQMNNPEQDVVGGYFGKAAFQRILNQDGCVGIRYYFGISEDGILHSGGNSNGRQAMWPGFEHGGPLLERCM